MLYSAAHRCLWCQCSIMLLNRCLWWKCCIVHAAQQVPVLSMLNSACCWHTDSGSSVLYFFKVRLWNQKQHVETFSWVQCTYWCVCVFAYTYVCMLVAWVTMRFLNVNLKKLSSGFSVKQWGAEKDRNIVMQFSLLMWNRLISFISTS